MLLQISPRCINLNHEKKKKGLVVERLTTQWMMEFIFTGPGIGGRFTKAAFTHAGKLDVESVLWMLDLRCIYT
jgi:hypothetical protein